MEPLKNRISPQIRKDACTHSLYEIEQLHLDKKQFNHSTKMVYNIERAWRGWKIRDLDYMRMFTNKLQVCKGIADNK